MHVVSIDNGPGRAHLVSLDNGPVRPWSGRPMFGLISHKTAARKVNLRCQDMQQTYISVQPSPGLTHFSLLPSLIIY
jgi:hypothetical protein